MLSLLSPLTNTLPAPSAFEVTTLWRYTNLFIIIIILFDVQRHEPALSTIPESRAAYVDSIASHILDYSFCVL